MTPDHHSPVLGGVAAAAADACRDVGTSEELHRLAEASAPHATESELAAAVLTHAANALRSATGQPSRPPISNSEDAFAELQAVAEAASQADRAGTPWSDDLASAAAALNQGLDVAVERLGPLPGGRMSSGGIVEPVSPTAIDLKDINHAAGRVIGELHRAGRLRAPDVLKELVA